MVQWRFQLNRNFFVYSRDDLLRAFNVSNRSIYPYVTKDESDAFWKLITGSDDPFSLSPTSTKIILSVWRIIHHFLSSCVILRHDEGRLVSKTDLELLCCFHKDVKFDPLTLITKSLEEATLPTFRGKYIAGGPFVTMIAQDIGYWLDQRYALPRRVLGEAEMIRRGFVKKRKAMSGFVRRLVSRGSSQKKSVGPGPSQREPSSSSASPRSVSNEELSAEIHALAAYQHEGLLWTNSVITDWYVRQSYDTFPPPPPQPPSIFDPRGGSDEDEEPGDDAMEEDSESSD